MDTHDPFAATCRTDAPPPPRLAVDSRPLAGLTLLAVEDSRFASEALRLICQRSGARIRRADSLAHARRHLMVYRPGCIIVDLGLPDGSGADLIAELAAATPRIGIILGTSGDPGGQEVAMAAGADGFLEKPIRSVAVFQTRILALMPPDRRPGGPRPLPSEEVRPDPVAYRDDLHHAAGMLAGPDGPGLDYVTQFLAGLARSAGDEALSRATSDLARARRSGFDPPAPYPGLPQFAQTTADQGPARARLTALIATRLRPSGLI